MRRARAADYGSVPFPTWLVPVSTASEACVGQPCSGGQRETRESGGASERRTDNGLIRLTLVSSSLGAGLQPAEGEPGGSKGDDAPTARSESEAEGRATAPSATRETSQRNDAATVAEEEGAALALPLHPASPWPGQVAAVTIGRSLTLSLAHGVADSDEEDVPSLVDASASEYEDSDDEETPQAVAATAGALSTASLHPVPRRTMRASAACSSGILAHHACRGVAGRDEIMPPLADHSDSECESEDEDDDGGRVRLADVCCVCEPQHRQMLHVFAGRPRAGSFEDAGAEFDVLVTSVDTLMGGTFHDVTQPDVRAALLRDVRAGRYEVVWLGTPCGSFSRLWLSGSERPPRSRSHPDGVDGLPDWQQRYVDLHNTLVELTEELATAAYEAGCTYVVENPVDYGAHGSRYFSWAARAHCPLWLASPMQRLAQATGALFESGCQCMIGGDFRKATTLMAAGPLADRLSSFGELHCTHTEHARVAFGMAPDGSYNSAAAAAYPVQMCYWGVQTLFGAREISAVGYAQRGDAVAAQQAAMAARAANAGAAASFLAAGPSAAVATAECDATEPCSDANETSERTSHERMQWRAAPEAMPADWPERGDAVGEKARQAREAELPFISRRRAEAEDPEVLARRPIQEPHPVPRLPAHPQQPTAQWPPGAPPRPISIEQLYNPGVYAEIRAEIAEHELEIRQGLERARRGSGVIGKRETRIWKAAECQPAWAASCTWDTSNPGDCVPLQPYSEDDPPQHAACRAFFLEWGRRLAWADEDMLAQVTCTGVQSRTDMARDTVIMGHHGGLRAKPGPAEESIASDTAKGWMTPARLDLWTVPTRSVPKNNVVQTKWRQDEGGSLYKKVKDRVTTDDSIEPQCGPSMTDSRNGAMNREGWGDVPLPSPRTLAEALAIVKSVAAKMGFVASQSVLERVALWAVDLADAYRALAAARDEHWQQCFVWVGGVKVDLRCEFGSAHMVDFFQRVATFVLAVARERIREYDKAHPYGAAREAWKAWRAGHLGAEQECTFAMIYIDDGSGLLPMADGEPLRGAAPWAPMVGSTVDVEAAGEGETPRVRLRLFSNKSRPEMHLAIVRSTFQEAGWDIAIEKVQLGWSIDLLGVGVTSEGTGCVYVPEPKRLGMREDIRQQLQADRALRPEVEELVGRCSHLGQVVCEGGHHLQPMYAFQNAAWTVDGKRRKPKWLQLRGKSSTQERYREALRFWDSSLGQNVVAPLAPRLCFPELGEEGCAYFFTDAAREDGTGYGAHATVCVNGRVFFVFYEDRWQSGPLRALQENRFSMPAGECYGAVLFADMLVRALGGVTHLVCFTDSDATARAFSATSSGAPQLNCLIGWLTSRHPDLQLMGVHQQGVRNGAADKLSRTAEGRREVLAAAAATGAELVELQLSEGDAAEASRLLSAAMACPLRL